MIGVKKKCYVVTETPYDGCTCKIKESNNQGYHFSPKNRVRYHGIQVNSLFVMKPSFIEKLLKKKVERKLDFYLQYLIDLVDDDTEGGRVAYALNDLTRYRDIIEYKYRKYLDDKYVDILLKKIALLEQEMKNKLMYQQWKNYTQPVYANPVTYQEDEKKGKSR